MVQIIGAGPVGNFAAYVLAKAGHEVTVHEEHAVIGKPIQCTGIITAYLSDFLSLGLKTSSEDFVVNTITGTRVFAPNGEHAYFPLKKNFIVDRQRFDSFIGELAQAEGATYRYTSRFVAGERRERGVYLRFSDGTEAHDDVVVGADGPSSLVARSFGLFDPRKFVVGVQARMKMKEILDPRLVDFYVDRAVPGYIGWLVPENEHIARVGVTSYEGTKKLFDNLVAKRPGNILEWQSGAIPLYNPRLRTEEGGVYLVGDAATMVKATTYGGILPGMHAAQCLPSALDGKPYQRLWKKKIGMNLWMHLRLRKAMDTFSERDYNRLLQYARTPGVQELLARHDREYPSKLAFGLALREPRFLRFAGHFLL